MSVLPMKRVLIIGLRKDRKQMLELLQRKGALQIITTKAEEDDQNDVFKHIDMSGARATFDKNVVLATSALAVLDSVVPSTGGGGMFAGREKMSLTDYETNTKRRDKIMEMVYDLNALSKKSAEIQADIPKYEAQLEALSPWMQFELPLEFNGTKTTKAFVGTLPNEQTMQQILEEIHKNSPEIEGVDVSIISASTEQTCVLIVCHKNDAARLEETLRRMNFARPVVSGGVPANQAGEIQNRLKKLHEEADKTKEKIASYGPKRDDLKFIIDYFKMRSDKYEIISGLSQTKRVFLIDGYIPAKDASSLQSLLESRFDCAIEMKDPDPSENPPVKLKNNWYATPVEGVVAGYSLPNKFEIDPTFIASLFYYCLFGLMLSDAGYGLVMIIFCGVVLAKNKNMEEGTAKFIKMLLGCGIGTLFWGVMFGSFFGDAATKIATTFFGVTEVPNFFPFAPVWFDTIKEPIRMLGFAFIIGLVHMFTGLGVLAYMDLKQGKVLDAIYDVLFWYMLLIGCVGLLLTTDMIASMFNININFPPAFATVMMVMALVGAVGIVLFGGRESKNPFKRILKGLYALYGISSYLSDMLSYSRLLALGLATAVISQVFNQMGTMAGNGPVGIVLFILVFLVGHTLNLLINALGAYVHTNRLEYVEFFGKFYNGGGKEFSPFKENTNYYNVQE
ncbi:MAG: V-type ATP synthase subunit I [Butyrivibrio sp.]|nr:V-type ATP synthase subunit I [Butyrivibrio sp.]